MSYPLHLASPTQWWRVMPDSMVWQSGWAFPDVFLGWWPPGSPIARLHWSGLINAPHQEWVYAVEPAILIIDGALGPLKLIAS